MANSFVLPLHRHKEFQYWLLDCEWTNGVIDLTNEDSSSDDEEL